ncbi:hypothetical protein [Streptococcus sp. DTU_2020_1000888_1_SI_GRL_NUU_041A]|uniref:hypothetical protein n=1 Tax=Streptococcus sp. DTU_2020_1000888_1_SI_GRL_NUU_041A TaxID=3077723 RepID=UPI0028E6171B|nr:hypothetical protein [Streptococcus sp. DTU_2020_1000888_1_SI_GRL_NUU_041A]WNU96051.1 hypothetical protein RSK81_12830 [Streptococcus sp. DTU_2020_1000888_1_SI_GRL_NUU_041A]
MKQKTLLTRIKDFILNNLLSDITLSLWAVFLAATLLVLFIQIVIVNHHVIFYYPFNFLNILVVIAIGVITALFIKYIGISYFKYSFKYQVLLYVAPLLISILGMIYPILYPSRTYADSQSDNVLITNQFNKKLLRQVFSPINLDNQEENSSEAPLIEGKTVYIFYKLGCPYCKAAIPEILSRLTAAQRERIVFVDLSNPDNARVAKHLGVVKAATAVSYQKHNGVFLKKIINLGVGTEEHPKTDETALLEIEEASKKEGE